MILEIGNAMAKARQRAAGLDLIEALQDDPAVEIVPLSDELCAEGVTLFRGHQDKEWGLADCISFADMRKRGLREALTADHHFRQAGFRAILADT